MGTSLTGLTPSTTYDALIKVGDNGPLSGTLKTLSDGLGNDSTLSLSTAAASIAGTLAVTGNATFDTNTLFVDAASNEVGIGTTSPSGKLHISATSGVASLGSTALAIRDAVASNYGFDFTLEGVSSGDMSLVRTELDVQSQVMTFKRSNGNVGIGTTAPTTTLDVQGTSFLRGNVNAGKTSNINTTTAVNGQGGGNREFDTFTGASATGFTGTDASDQGFGYFACTIVSGRSYEISATMVVTNGQPLSFITSTGRNFATDTVQQIEANPISNTVYRFVASGNATFAAMSASNSGGGMTCVVSNFSIKEVGSVLVASDSNVGIGTTTPAVKLDVIGNIRSSEGILFGTDTASANALDDYEEGTWTMGVSFGGASVGVTTSLNTGTYTKIGRQVTVCGNIELTSKGSSTGSARITGLPFTIASGQSFYSATSLYFANITFTNQFQGYGNVNATTIDFRETTVLGLEGPLTDADFANNSSIMVSLTYFV